MIHYRAGAGATLRMDSQWTCWKAMVQTKPCQHQKGGKSPTDQNCCSLCFRYTKKLLQLEGCSLHFHFACSCQHHLLLYFIRCITNNFETLMELSDTSRKNAVFSGARESRNTHLCCTEQMLLRSLYYYIYRIFNGPC